MPKKVLQARNHFQTTNKRQGKPIDSALVILKHFLSIVLLHIKLYKKTHQKPEINFVQ